MTDAENRSELRSLIKVESIFPNAIDVGDYITKKFDYIVKSDLYKNDDTCMIYNLMREIALDKEDKIKRPMIILSPDNAIASATISGTAERHMVRTSVNHDIRGERVEGIDFDSELRVLYISSKLGIYTDSYDGIASYQNSVMSNAMGLTEQSFTNHRVNVKPSNVIFLGIRSDLIENSEQTALDAMSIKPIIFDLDRIRERGIDRIMRFIQNRFKNQKIHVVFDMSAIDVSIAPSVLRFNVVQNIEDESGPAKSLEEMNHIFRGLTREEVLRIMECVSTIKEESNLESFDLVNYNFSIEEYREHAHPGNVITSKIMLDILNCVSDFTHHSLNIFDETSRFLIWKKIPPVFTNEVDEDLYINYDKDPKGWFILRGVDLDTRNKIISHFTKLKNEINDTDSNAMIDSNLNNDLTQTFLKLEYPIERFEFPDDDEDEILDVLISVTTPMEQNLKSYYSSTSYLDRCLMPGEKVNMTFELLATPSTIKILNEQAKNTPPDIKIKLTSNDQLKDDQIENDLNKDYNYSNIEDNDSRLGVDSDDLEELQNLHTIYKNIVNNSNKK